MKIAEILSPEAVRAGIRVQGKKRLFLEIAEMTEGMFGLDADAVRLAMSEREALGPTGVGHGVAIPHARLPDISRVQGLFLRLDQPVEYDSVDRKPVDLVFALLAPASSGAEHLRALASVSRALRDEGTCRKLRSTDDVSAIYAILTDGLASRAA
jgi:PTS system nitrogen regulatory IIA component